MKIKDKDWDLARQLMVCDQLQARGITDENVLQAMAIVPRHLFVPVDYQDLSYSDSPLPIGGGQTISQPYLVALMSELLAVRPGDKVLEIGTGSGYAAAVLAAMGMRVFSLEIRPPLAHEAAGLLAQLDFTATMVTVAVGDGYRGMPIYAPFAGIVVTAAALKVPAALIDQLRLGGKLVIPVDCFPGSTVQELQVLTKSVDGVQEKMILPVRFVPMTGEISGHNYCG